MWTEEQLEEVWNQCLVKVKRMSERLQDGFPHVSKGGRYDNMQASWWTAGFYPGLLWLMYRDSAEESFRRYAEACEDQLDKPLLEYEKLHHDVGFMWSLSAVAQYKLLGSNQSRKRGLIAASHLASRFNVKGGFIRAWNGKNKEGWAIVDCLMNLPLLYWASETTEDPRFRWVAEAHADMAAQEFVREDGSVHHIICFDPTTGERVGARGGQGFSPDSAWARGSAWALYGFALSYKYTGKTSYLRTAQRVAHYFVSHLREDGVPKWDFRADSDSDDIVDTSAAACAASGLLELAELTDGEEARFYCSWAERILLALYQHYGAWDQDEEGLIMKSTVSYPENRDVHVPVIYGDYFFVEALAKLRGQRDLFW